MADRIEVAWPRGARDGVEAAPADGLVVVREGAGLVRREPFVTRRLAACAEP